MRPLRVLHVISSLGPAGAERMLYNIVEATRSDALEHAVVSLTGDGVMGEMLRARGIPVSWLGMRSGIPDPLAAARLVSRIRAARPDLVQSWMYHADLLAGLAAAGRVPVVWGIRNGDPRGMKWLTHVTRAVCARLSGIVPTRIVCCADAVMRSHTAAGYRPERMVVIPNGFDLGRFAPDPAAGARVRAELGIPAGAAAVGLVARFHPDKDHRTFLLAARAVADAVPSATFLLAGSGVTPANAVLGDWIAECGLGDRVRLLGVRSDVPAVIAGLDVLAQSSRVEGFPNVLGEAMACGIPVAATSCGESEEIVGDTGRLVPSGDPGALASALVDLLVLPAERRAALGRAARRRVMERYDLRAVARRYQALWEQVAEARGFRTADAGS